jgi:hypothetical protein
MKWTIPGTVLQIERQEAEHIHELFPSMFLAGGIVLSQVSGITGLEPYTVQNDDVLTLTVKKDITDTEPIIEKKVTGNTTFHLEPKDTTGLNFGKYKYDVQINTAEGEVYTIISPTAFEILAEVTV